MPAHPIDATILLRDEDADGRLSAVLRRHGGAAGRRRTTRMDAGARAAHDGRRPADPSR
jgi:hypothetical protein